MRGSGHDFADFSGSGQHFRFLGFTGYLLVPELILIFEYYTWSDSFSTIFNLAEGVTARVNPTIHMCS